MILSIIIATKNREEILLETISKIIESIGNKNWIEILIINDSEKKIINIETNQFLKIINNNSEGVSKARNLGALNAKGEYFFFCDDDMWITNDFLDWFIKKIQNSEFKEYVYNINWSYPDELIEILQKNKIGRYLLNSNYHTMWGRLGNNNIEPNDGLLLIKAIGSGSLLIHHTIFKLIEGYNENIIFQGEDIDLSNKINQEKLKIFAVFDIKLYHNQKDRLEIETYLNREYRGYQSEINCRNSGILEHKIEKINNIKKLLSNFEIIYKILFQIIPNQKKYDKINFKLIGFLSMIQKIKAIKKG